MSPCGFEKGSKCSRMCSVLEPLRITGVKRSPGQLFAWICGTGEGVIVFGKGRYSVGRISAAWCTESPPRWMKAASGEACVRQSALT